MDARVMKKMCLRARTSEGTGVGDSVDTGSMHAQTARFNCSTNRPRHAPRMWPWRACISPAAKAVVGHGVAGWGCVACVNGEGGRGEAS